jgi:dihydroorotate dehydrogenase (NAD+) catalytic subunit
MAYDQSVNIGSLTLKNPVLTASGTFGYALEYDDFYDVATLGGICTKGLSLHPLAGNQPNRICETAAGMLNAIGLANIGVDAFCRDKLPKLRSRGVTVVANIFGTTIDEFVAITRRLDGEDGVHALELNVSCPNVKQGGLLFGCDADLAAQVTAAVRAATQMPVWVKMSPEAGDPIGVARACQRAGADAITAINTIRGAAIDIETQKPRVHHRTGGLSGPAIKPLALRIVWDLADALDIPVIGIGGIATAEDAIEFLLAGATAIQVGTANFADPCAGAKIKDGIVAYCERQGVPVRDLIGRVKRAGP